jgi:hypothetical protein
VIYSGIVGSDSDDLVVSIATINHLHYPDYFGIHHA